jgi:hypothetical protein
MITGLRLTAGDLPLCWVRDDADDEPPRHPAYVRSYVGRGSAKHE